MTYLELLAEAFRLEGENEDVFKAAQAGCPPDYFNGADAPIDCRLAAGEKVNFYQCFRCWSREAAE